MSPKAKPRPLWRCPKCGKYYVTRNMWHACARHSVTEHFTGRDPKLRLLFDLLVALVKRNGPLRVVPGKTGIAFQQRMRFGGAVVRRNYIEAGFLLPRRVEHPRMRKIIAYSRHAYGHHVEVRTPADLDEELAGWLRESYRVGQQLDLLAGKKRLQAAPGDFAWSELSVSRSLPRKSARLFPGTRRNIRKARSSEWRCPKCGRSFATRNQVHMCSQLTLKDALRGKSRIAVALLRKVTAIVHRFGPVEIVPQKTRIALRARRIFLGVRLLRDAIDCELALPRRMEHPRFRQVLSPSPGSHYHYFRIASAAELDREVSRWLREAYAAA